MSVYRLVTLDEVKRNSRYVGTASDVELQEMIDDASQHVLDYIQSAWARARQYSGDDDVTDEEIAAYERAFGGWTDSSGNPLVDSSGDPLIVDYDTDSNGDPVLDSNGDYVGGHSIIPGQIRRATLLVVAHLDENRSGGDVRPINAAVESLLVRYRPPTVA